MSRSKPIVTRIETGRLKRARVRLAAGLAMCLVASVPNAETLEVMASENRYVQKEVLSILVNGELNAINYYSFDGYSVFDGDIILGSTTEVALINLLAGVDFEKDMTKVSSPSDISARLSRELAPRGLAIKRLVGGKPRRWPNATIPYYIQSGHPAAPRIRAAIAHWAKETDLKFVDITSFLCFLPAKLIHRCTTVVHFRECKGDYSRST